MNAKSILATAPADLATLNPKKLLQLKTEAANALTMAKSVAERIDLALDIKYRERAAELRRQAGKDCGTVHFDDGLIHVTAELPKKVEWNQGELAKIVQRIAASGGDPARYVDYSYSVSEPSYKTWPDTLKESFEPARRVKTGKPVYKLVPIDGGGR